MRKYSQGWRELNTPKQDVNPWHALWVAPILYFLLIAVMSF